MSAQPQMPSDQLLAKLDAEQAEERPPWKCSDDCELEEGDTHEHCESCKRQMRCDEDERQLFMGAVPLVTPETDPQTGALYEHGIVQARLCPTCYVEASRWPARELVAEVNREVEATRKRLAQGVRQLGRGPNTPAEDGELITVKMSSVIAKPIIPIMPGLLYKGKITVIAGLPGDGKSVTALDIAARMTIAAPWPVGNGRFAESTVMLLTAEDDIEDTIRPRLDAAGANCDRIEFVKGVVNVDADGQRTLDMVSLIADVDKLERRIVESESAGLVVDPLTSFADSDTNKTADMRRLLDRLSQMAARRGIAIIIITHLNKRSDVKRAMQMIAGSHVITAAVRAVFVTSVDPQDQDRVLLLPVKLNIGKKEGGFAFRLVDRQHPICGQVPALEWERQRVTDVSADEALVDSSPRTQAAAEKSAEIQDWLRELMHREPVLAVTMWNRAKDQGYSERAVRNALKALGCRAEVMGYQGRWHYRLPRPTEPASESAPESDAGAPL